MSGRTHSTTTLHAETTVADGAELDAAAVTGSIGTASGASGQTHLTTRFSLVDQSSSGDAALGTDEYSYLSTGSSAEGAHHSSSSLTVDLQVAPLPEVESPGNPSATTPVSTTPVANQTQTEPPRRDVIRTGRVW